jgi:hypothetical protein
MNTLLDKAMSYKKTPRARRDPTPEEMELALAWANDQITYTQAQHALVGSTGMTGYVRLALSLKAIIKQKGITIQ